MNRLDLVKSVRALIAEPARWTQGWDARDSAGEKCSADSDQAVCWCLVGAMRKLGGPSWSEPRALVRSLMVRAIGVTNPSPGFGYLVEWNDHPQRRHADVIALLDRLIGDLA